VLHASLGRKALRRFRQQPHCVPSMCWQSYMMSSSIAFYGMYKHDGVQRAGAGPAHAAQQQNSQA
jgi:hypothetical protein